MPVASEPRVVATGSFDCAVGISGLPIEGTAAAIQSAIIWSGRYRLLGTQSSRLLSLSTDACTSSRDDCVPRPVATPRGSDTRVIVVVTQTCHFQKKSSLSDCRTG